MDPAPLYASKYCEENVWHLCRHPALSTMERAAVFVSNARKACPLWMQRASPDVAEPVLWDYHVVLLAQDGGRWRVYDLDSRLPFPCRAAAWLDGTFPFLERVERPFQPRFRVVDAAVFLDTFASDRSHMRMPGGGWQAPPPPWPAIQPARGTNLIDFVDMDARFVGEVMELPRLRERVRDRCI